MSWILHVVGFPHDLFHEIDVGVRSRKDLQRFELTLTPTQSDRWPSLGSVFSSGICLFLRKNHPVRDKFVYLMIDARIFVQFSEMWKCNEVSKSVWQTTCKQRLRTKSIDFNMSEKNIGEFSVSHLLNVAEGVVDKKTSGSALLDTSAEGRIPKFKLEGMINSWNIFCGNMCKLIYAYTYIYTHMTFIFLSNCWILENWKN